MTFYPFINEDGEKYGSFEVFYAGPAESWTDDTTVWNELLIPTLEDEGLIENEEQFQEAIAHWKAVEDGLENEDVKVGIDELPVEEFLNRVTEIIRTHLIGWYWWPGFPGCLPDGEPTGPFQTEIEAIADAWDMEIHEAREKLEEI